MCDFFYIIDEGLNRNSNQVAIIESSTQRKITYDQLKASIFMFQKYIIQLGVCKSMKVAIIGANSPEWVVSYLAVTALGGIVVPISPLFPLDTCKKILAHCGIDYVITENITNYSEYKAISFDYVKWTSNKGTIWYNDTVIDKDLQCIIYTSGTSSSPKGVMLSYRSLSLNLYYALTNMPLQTYDTICSFLPFSHSLGCMYNFLYPITQSATNVIVTGKITLPTILQACTQYHPHVIYSVPLIVEKSYHIAQKNIYNAKYLLSTELQRMFGGRLKELIIGGASLNREIEKSIIEAGFPLTIGYGMTECGPVISYATNSKRRLYSSGNLVPFLEVKITDKNELLVKGESVFLGYYNDAKATNKVIRDSWFYTGDIVAIEGPEQSIYNIGRLKNVILGPNGINIFPEEIEQIWNSLPHVIASLVQKKNNSLYVILYMNPILKHSEQVQIATEYLEKVNSQLPPYSRIHNIIYSSTDFERTSKNDIKRTI